MNTTNQELKLKLSLLLDNELSSAERHGLLDRVNDEPQLRQAWARYNLIGEVIRSEKGVFAGDDFARRVSRAVAQEPPAVAVFPGRSARSSPEPSRKARVINARSGLAWAAALAGFAVVIGYSGSTPDLSRIDLALQQKDATLDQSQEAVADARFNDYLMTHNEVSSQVGSTSMLPHARLVSSPGR
ncbi:sigma-E factor negative regulatory protein [Candidatus Methylospira mobilis]|uniref:Sigma-E factor negative regulatory protein n=1 Tax=Candidatus Methylospira mobilis TaxID=1808979 RepID=A0A5Q0BGE2_9GAMM|nr:sigma-E factor negative regulatory protein [Candidatus Methylospira mobilis]QFY42903.1 sigma-E factor negative regulatory protein [Candidatus Methylospira mobilis]WNV03861.1 sigma-E factor negative regulatory protein [Candidatus Methylospira mobilis]